MVESGHSVLVIGETGSGVDDLAVAVSDRFEGKFTCATETYKGATKTFFKSLAEQVDVPTEIEVGEGKFKPMNVEEMKDEILSNACDDWLFILPEAKRLPASIRYWLEDAIASGVKVVAFSPINPGRDVFLRMLEVELELPSDAHIRNVMTSEARRLGLQIDQSRIAELQPLAGRNPMIARKVIQREKLGMKQDKVEHTQGIVIMPILVAALFSFAVVRFVGLGTNNKGLYITGGVCLTVGMALKQLSRVSGTRRKLGQ